MIIFQYDSSFEGLLTSVFDSFNLRKVPDVLIGNQDNLPLFHDEVCVVRTDKAKAERVWNGLTKKVSSYNISLITRCWMTELPNVAMLLFRYLHKIFSCTHSIESNFTDPDVLAVFQLGKKVTDEYTRALQFVRFQKTVDNIYFAILEPLYNILPLTINHFRNRFSDQQWIIYDVKRKYGIYYDCNTIHEVTFSDTTLLNLQQILSTPENLAQNELLLQTLWKSYFNTICIKERLNPRKQKKDMPVRYWKYLTEKY